MSFIESQNHELKLKLKNLSSEMSHQKAVMNMKMEQLEERIRDFQRQEEFWRKNYVRHRLKSEDNAPNHKSHPRLNPEEVWTSNEISRGTAEIKIGENHFRNKKVLIKDNPSSLFFDNQIQPSFSDQPYPGSSWFRNKSKSPTIANSSPRSSNQIKTFTVDFNSLQSKENKEGVSYGSKDQINFKESESTSNRAIQQYHRSERKKNRTQLREMILREMRSTQMKRGEETGDYGSYHRNSKDKYSELRIENLEPSSNHLNMDTRNRSNPQDSSHNQPYGFHFEDHHSNIPFTPTGKITQFLEPSISAGTGGKNNVYFGGSSVESHTTERNHNTSIKRELMQYLSRKNREFESSAEKEKNSGRIQDGRKELGGDTFSSRFNEKSIDRGASASQERKLIDKQIQTEAPQKTNLSETALNPIGIGTRKKGKGYGLSRQKPSEFVNLKSSFKDSASSESSSRIGGKPDLYYNPDLNSGVKMKPGSRSVSKSKIVSNYKRNHQEDSSVKIIWMTKGSKVSKSTTGLLIDNKPKKSAVKNTQEKLVIETPNNKDNFQNTPKNSYFNIRQNSSKSIRPVAKAIYHTEEFNTPKNSIARQDSYLDPNQLLTNLKKSTPQLHYEPSNKKFFKNTPTNKSTNLNGNANSIIMNASSEKKKINDNIIQSTQKKQGQKIKQLKSYII